MDRLGFLLEIQMDLTTTTGMDSRNIAELTGKNHADVCRDVRKMLDELGEDESKFASVYQGGNGEDRRCYVLPKRECLILASGYSVVLRAKIIDRWAELEAGRRPERRTAMLSIRRGSPLKGLPGSRRR